MKICHALFALPLALAACTSESQKSLSPSLSADTSGLKAGEKMQPASPPPPVLKSLGHDDEASCFPLNPELEKTLPYWLKEYSLMATQLLKTCKTSDQLAGYSPHSPWVAMGFPCTGGSGQIDITGSYYAPKIVSFALATDCKMRSFSSQDLQKASHIIQSVFHLQPTAKLLAINPFALQYWELIGQVDADVGFHIELRSPDAKQKLWRQFIDKKPIPIKLYGRENAWARSDYLFCVDGELQLTGPHAFQLQIHTVKALSTEEIAQVRQRCEALQPRRNCQQVFASISAP